jgi:hypothetical protein
MDQNDFRRGDLMLVYWGRFEGRDVPLEKKVTVGDSNLVVFEFLESYKLPRIANWVFSVTWGRRGREEERFWASALHKAVYSVSTDGEQVWERWQQRGPSLRKTI